MIAIVIKPGSRFGRLTVTKPATPIVEKSGDRRKAWECVCSCGNTSIIRDYSLRSGNTSSCGCLHKEIATNLTAKLNLIHGRYGTKEYKSWQGMKARCYFKAHHNYGRYGGRGITVCERWRNSFSIFFADMGLCPSPIHTLDRIDNDGNYEPGNCRWATPKQQLNNQRRNRRLMINGVALTLQEWAEKSGINRSTISSRIEHGWPLERVVSEQARRQP